MPARRRGGTDEASTRSDWAGSSHGPGLRSDELQLRVDHVHQVGAARPEGALQVAEELLRREMPRHRPAPECVADREVVRPSGFVLDEQASISDFDS